MKVAMKAAGRRGTARLAGLAAWRLPVAALLLATTFFGPGVTVERKLFDHVIVVDITQSMNVQDQQVAGKPAARLAFAKQALRQALLDLPCGSRVGWGVFTEYRSYLLFAPVEVCAHLSELRATLAGIDGRMAWAGSSEIAKGLYSGIGVARQLPGTPSFVFVTDGQEAPPVNPRYRPTFNGKPGEVGGVIVGVGALTASPIPKTDPAGRPLGYWRADEVMQTDLRSRGRGGSVGGEALVEEAGEPKVAPIPGAAPGSEHLSSLREAYLRLLAGETGLAFLHLQDEAGLARALTAPGLARPTPARADLRPALALLAAVLVLWPVLVSLWRLGVRPARARPPRAPPHPGRLRPNE